MKNNKRTELFMDIWIAVLDKGKLGLLRQPGYDCDRKMFSLGNLTILQCENTIKDCWNVSGVEVW